MSEWILVLLLATGNAYELRVGREACLAAPAMLRAGELAAARMSDGSLVPILAAVCTGPAGAQPQQGAGS